MILSQELLEDLVKLLSELDRRPNFIHTCLLAFLSSSLFTCQTCIPAPFGSPPIFFLEHLFPPTNFLHVQYHISNSFSKDTNNIPPDSHDYKNGGDNDDKDIDNDDGAGDGNYDDKVLHVLSFFKYETLC